MADNIIPFDKYHSIKRRLPGFGTPTFADAYVEARAFVHVAEGRFLSCAQLTFLASKLSPYALCLLREMVRELRGASGERHP